MNSISTSALLLFGLSLLACRTTESANGQTMTSAVNASVQADPEATKVLREYHQALIAGDSVKARSLATGTALAVLEYRFFRSTSDDNLRFSYGPQNIIRDTCYIPVRVRNGNTRDPEQQGKAILVKVKGAWKVERIAMQK